MSYLFIGMLLGSMVTSSHETREACEGRKVLLVEKGVNGKCVEFGNFGISSGNVMVTPNLYVYGPSK